MGEVDQEKHSNHQAEAEQDEAADTELVPLNANQENSQPEDGVDLFQTFSELNKAGPVMQFFLQVWRFTFQPEGLFHRIWDTFILLLVIFSGFWEPFKAAYLPVDQEMHPLEWLVDILFYTDIFINFNTGYDSGAGIINDKKLIAKRYLRYWFWIDMLATVEWDQMFGSFLEGATQDSSTKRLLSCFRLFKVFRLARLDRLIARLTASWTIHTGYIEALKFFFYVFIVAHLLACFFFFWPELWPYSELVCENTKELVWSVVVPLPALTSGVTAVAKTNTQMNVTYGYDNQCSEQKMAWKDSLVNETIFTKYIDCMYWAITTMTTIGYGDRGPSNSHEIIFVLFAEVFGLTFFALLLTQINNLNDVLGAQVQANNEIKNEIIGFMKHHDMNAKLITKVIKFLNFKANSRSGNEFHENDGGFAALSPPLKKQLRVALLKPYLLKVKMFGHDILDLEEENLVKSRFDRADTSGDGDLEYEEIKKLIEDMSEKQANQGCFGGKRKQEVVMSEEDIQVAFNEMDQDGGKAVEKDEFVSWHLFKKHKKSRLPRAPEIFIEELAYKMSTIAYSHGDHIVKPGRYGSKLSILLSGRASIYKGNYQDIVGNQKVPAWKGTKSGKDDPTENNAKVKKISSTDREPAIGMLSFLDKDHYKRFKKTLNTVEWEVRADKFCDACYISRHDLQVVIEENWKEVQEPFVMLAAYFYNLKSETDHLSKPVLLQPLGDDDGHNLKEGKESSEDVADRMRKQGETINKLGERIETVTTSLNRLDASLDLILRQMNHQRFDKLSEQRRLRRSPSNSSFSFSSVRDDDETKTDGKYETDGE